MLRMTIIHKGEPMSDLIDRQAAIDALDVLCQQHRYKIPGKRETYSQYNEAWQDALDRAEGAIGNLPSAQPKQRMGKWVLGNMCSVKGYWVTCSVCGHTSFGGGNFCRECGAKMGGNAE